MTILLLIWTFASLLNAYHCRYHYKIDSHDLLQEVLPALNAVLDSLQFRSCSIAFVTDSGIPSTTFKKFTEMFDTEVTVGIFEVPGVKGHSIKALDSLKKIQASSGCLLVTAIGNDLDFLTSVVKYTADNHILVWPTKFIAITQISIHNMEVINELCSFVNGIIIILKENSRCDMYSSLPYSDRTLKVAAWSHYEGLTIASGHNLFFNKFNKFMDAPQLRIAGDEYPPHMAVQELSDVSDGQRSFTFSGPMVHVLHLLADSMNFTYMLRRSVDGSWGYRRPNGSWTGMVGMVRRKEIDFALGPFGVTYSRATVLDYSLPLLFDYARITARQGDTEIDMWGFLMPFQTFVWISILVSLVLIVLATWGVAFTASKEIIPSEKFILNYFRVMFQQDIPRMSKHQWMRFMMASWIITILVLVKSYSGVLMSLLAVRYIPQPYQTLRDVVEDQEMSMIWEASTAYVQYFMSAQSGIFKGVADASDKGMIKFIPSMQYYSSLDTLVHQGSHVFIVEDLSLKMLLAKHFTQKGSCRFYLSKDMFLPLSFALVVQKKSALRQAINERVKALTESGLYYHWLENAIPNSTACSHVPSKKTVQSYLSITNLWGMFVLLLGGIGFSFVTLGIEILSKKI